jgi:hypothetical protein
LGDADFFLAIGTVEPPPPAPALVLTLETDMPLGSGGKLKLCCVREGWMIVMSPEVDAAVAGSASALATTPAQPTASAAFAGAHLNKRE